MIIVRNCFVAKPGQAGKLAEKFKQAASSIEGFRFRVLTDVTGDFNRVVFEYEADNIAEFEERMRQYNTGEIAFRDKMAGYTDLYITGNREILRVL